MDKPVGASPLVPEAKSNESNELGAAVLLPADRTSQANFWLIAAPPLKKLEPFIESTGEEYPAVAVATASAGMSTS